MAYKLNIDGIEYTAVQWDPRNDPREMYDFLTQTVGEEIRKWGKYFQIVKEDNQPQLLLHTIWGSIKVKPGEFILLKDSFDKYSILHPIVFESHLRNQAPAVKTKAYTYDFFDRFAENVKANTPRKEGKNPILQVPYGDSEKIEVKDDGEYESDRGCDTEEPDRNVPGQREKRLLKMLHGILDKYYKYGDR